MITLNIPAKRKDSSALNHVLKLNLDIIEVKHSKIHYQSDANNQINSLSSNNDSTTTNDNKANTDEGILRKAMKWYVEKGPEALDDPQSVLSVLNDGKI